MLVVFLVFFIVNCGIMAANYAKLNKVLRKCLSLLGGNEAMYKRQMYNIL